MRKVVLVAATAAAMMMMASAPALASASKRVLFHDGSTIRTVVVTVPIPDQGTDPFYLVTNGTADQLGIAGVAQGDGPYHGGAWEVFTRILAARARSAEET